MKVEGTLATDVVRVPRERRHAGAAAEVPDPARAVAGPAREPAALQHREGRHVASTASFLITNMHKLSRGSRSMKLLGISA